MAANETLETATSWLDEGTLDAIRGQVPMVYVEAVPVRVDHLGRIERVGLLLRAQPDGSVSRAVVSGRVLYNETVRDALWRHLTKDLGPEAEPHLPAGVAPFTIAEYFPDPARSGFHDPRQHAVALCYVVPVTGECHPSQESLDLAWFTPAEAVDPVVAAEMSGGHGRLVRRALAHGGQLP